MMRKIFATVLTLLMVVSICSLATSEFAYSIDKDTGAILAKTVDD